LTFTVHALPADVAAHPGAPEPICAVVEIDVFGWPFALCSEMRTDPVLGESNCVLFRADVADVADGTSITKIAVGRDDGCDEGCVDGAVVGCVGGRPPFDPPPPPHALNVTAAHSAAAKEM
jgi:hypothetical protein